MDAVILAAGKGSRLKPFTDEMPKPLIKINGKPILEHIIRDLSENGFKKVYFIIGYMKDKVISFVDSVKEKYSIESVFITQDKLLGTGHAISLLPNNISKNFLLLAGDTLFIGAPLKEIIKKDRPLYVLEKTKDSLRRSIVEINAGKIVNIKYNFNEILDKPVYTDISLIVLPREIIEYAKKEKFLNEITLATVVDKMIKDGSNFDYIEFKGKIRHITSTKDLEN
jgi:NDP-sugar pyrophosphorylase family protein